MSYETVKSFILVVLIAISFLLSFILWSYQPNYDYLYSADYVNEVDIGGDERGKNELLKPNKIILREGEEATGFYDMVEQQQLFQSIKSWELSDYKIKEVEGRPNNKNYVELIFPPKTPVELVSTIFTFRETPELPNWTFSRIFLRMNEESNTLKLGILSDDQTKMMEATIDKTDAYDIIQSSFSNEEALASFVTLEEGDHVIYVKSGPVQLKEKTFVASKIKPDLFINALFTNPNLVTQNMKEAYFTDGQRGMRIVQDGRLLQFINPLQEKFEHSSALELLEKSVNNINEHKGWTNNYYIESIRPDVSNIRYRLHYAGYPVYNYGNLTIIEQSWREQDLHEYNRPLVRIGNLLNARDIELISGEELIAYLQTDNEMELDKIEDIELGYMLNFLEDDHSLTLEPQWSIYYEGQWTRFNVAEYERQRGGDL